MMTRLQKFLAQNGVASRRKAEDLISAGRVAVNGQTVTAMGTKIDPFSDTVTLDGRSVSSGGKLVYVILHKPEGVITSVSDPQKRPVVMKYVKDVPERIFPVGRLDFDSSGLLLLTNDGDLAQILTHPRHEVPKTYIATLQGIPNRRQLLEFKEGIDIEGSVTAPAEIEVIRRKYPHSCTVRISIHEGRNRQIRKMCAAIGCPVVQLKRVSIGKLHLGNLPRGQYRHLTKAEVRNLKNLEII